MKTLIEREAQERHNIEKYKFKVFAMGAADESEPHPPAKEESDAVAEPSASPTAAEVQEFGGNRDELIDSLLKKADEMSSSVIKMQMKLEEAEAACKAQLEAERSQAYETGVKEGRNQVQKEQETAYREGVTSFAASVETLETRSKEFSHALDALREELVHAAIDIAKEVISMEVGERSGAIAAKMASELIGELQGASRVTLRVNPADHGPVSEAVGSLERVEIVSDSAVSRGGVVAISNAGNIDAEVTKRFERIKNAALSG